jgi:hypothetical protein
LLFSKNEGVDMKLLLMTAALALGTAASAQSTNIRVAPGHMCALNKCLWFSDDMQIVQTFDREYISVAQYQLEPNSVISGQVYREIFALALRQAGVNDTR